VWRPSVNETKKKNGDELSHPDRKKRKVPTRNPQEPGGEGIQTGGLGKKYPGTND